MTTERAAGPLAVVVGFVGKLPVAGMTQYNVHYIAGLQDLGYEVHYVERQNRPQECYDPIGGGFTDDPAYALHYLASVMADLEIGSEGWSFIDRDDACHGSDWSKLALALMEADFVLTLADETWFDELEFCAHRAFIDGDPVFTQMAMADKSTIVGRALASYDTLFSTGTRIGLEDCPIPPQGRRWLPTRSVVATRLWEPLPPPSSDGPATVLMHWAAAPDVTIDGVTYGHKNRELERFLDLPSVTSKKLRLAVGGPEAPRDMLREHGWEIANPLEATITIDAYRRFIAESWADLGIAKHAYVASRSGWFSDRSLCYMAAGRPVLHQDTGFGEWLPTGRGVLAFSDEDEILEGIEEIESDYEGHSRAAREIAEEYLEASVVIGDLLDRAGFR